MIAVLARGPSAFAQSAGFLPSTDDFGGVGLLQMPSARFGADGEFFAGVSSAYPYNRLFFTVQALPWLQGTLRYSEVANRLYSSDPEFSGNQTSKDRGADLKFRLNRESEYMPQMALGIQDFLGTGLFSGEYLAASKRYYDWDFTLGIGWGYLGNRGNIRNPLCVLAGRFCRDRQTVKEVGQGGTVNLNTLFTGERASLFAGVEYRTPVKGLRLKAELDGNDYQNEPFDNNLKVDLPINFGATYRVFDWLDVSVGLERGNTFMAQLVADTNFNTYRGLKKYDPPPAKIVPRTEAQRREGRRELESDSGPLGEWEEVTTTHVAEADADVQGGKQAVETLLAAERALAAQRAAERAKEYEQTEKRITKALENIGFQVYSVDVTDWQVTAFVSQDIYPHLPEAVGRAARIMSNHAPLSVELLTVVLMEQALEVNRTTLWRQDLEKEAEYMGSAEEIWPHSELSAGTGKLPAGSYINPARYPHTSWFMVPGLRQHIGGPDNFYFYQLYLRLGGELQMRKGLSATGVLGLNLVDNFDGLKQQSNSKLPKVRSDIAQYLKQGKNGIYRLELDYLWKLDPSWYARLSGGLLEEMYGGVGGEVLYRRYGSRWAVGADLNWVKQRDFDMQFGFRDYQTVTGLGTFYYELPFYDMVTAISAGRYLAKDVGTTIDIARRFKSGIIVGGFATFTNVSAEQFGEGSFDKGFYISLPLDLFYTRSTRSRAHLVWRPLTRDGGQRLVTGKQLYPYTVEASPGAMGRDWDYLLQ